MLNVRFIKSATRKDQYPDLNLPSIAFAGRSNVGKSSFINCLLRRKNLARTSKTPGRTQVINFFNVDDRWVFVDLPGYGFAGVPARVRARWAPMIEEFLLESPTLALVFTLVDARHEPSPLDSLLAEWLRVQGIPFRTVATKMDKISAQQRQRSLNRVCEKLGVQEAVPFSALTGEGRKTVWEIIKGV